MTEPSRRSGATRTATSTRQPASTSSPGPTRRRPGSTTSARAATAASSPTPAAASPSTATRATGASPATATTRSRPTSRAATSTCATRRPASSGAPPGSRSGATWTATSAATAPRYTRISERATRGSRPRSSTSSRSARSTSPCPCELWVLPRAQRRHRPAAPAQLHLRRVQLLRRQPATSRTSTGPSTSSSARCEDGTIRVADQVQPARSASSARSEPPAGYTCDREDFVGRCRDLADPIVVETGEPSNAPSPRGNSIGSLGPRHRACARARSAGSSTSWASPSDRPRSLGVVARFGDPAEVEAAFAELRDDWDAYLSRFTVETPDPDTNAMLNFWNQVQCRTTLYWSRFVSGYETGLGRGMGTRDSAQDTLGTMHAVPDHARRMLTQIWELQFRDGHTWHQFFPLTGEGGPGLAGEFPSWPQWFSDDHLWLIIAVCAYLRETGDFAYLDAARPLRRRRRRHGLGAHAARRSNSRSPTAARTACRARASPTGTTRSTSTTGRARPRASGPACSSAGRCSISPTCATTRPPARKPSGSRRCTRRWRRSINGCAWDGAWYAALVRRRRPADRRLRAPRTTPST